MPETHSGTSINFLIQGKEKFIKLRKKNSIKYILENRLMKTKRKCSHHVIGPSILYKEKTEY